MSAVATDKVVRTEARLFTRELGTLFWILLFSTLLIAILGAVPSFRVPDEALGGQRVVDLYASVSVLLAMIMASLMSMPSVITAYREAGILRRLRTTPVHPGSLLLAQVGLHAVAVLGSLVLVLGFARLVYDVALPQQIAWYAMCVVLATAAAFSVGAVVSSMARTTRTVQTVGTVVFFLTVFFGVLPLLNALPGGNGALGLTCPACVQQRAGSDFLRELNSGGDTVPGVDNIVLQRVCPLDLTDHLGISYDANPGRLVLNALDPDNAQRVVCRPAPGTAS